jgi:hypothetical protein
MTSAPVMIDFDWSATFTVSSSAIEQPQELVPLLRLHMKLSDGSVRALELSADQLDAVIASLAEAEKRSRYLSRAAATNNAGES